MDNIQDYIDKQFEFSVQIEKLSDDEKIKYIESLDSNAIDTYNKRRLLIIGLSDDDKKIEYTKKYLKPNDIIKAYCSLKSDKKKFEIATNKINSDKNDASRIFKSMQSDELKLKSLEYFKKEEQDQSNIKSIIKEMDSDDLKIQALKNYLLPSSYIDVLSTLKSYEKKIENIDLIKNDPELYLYVAALQIQDDSKKLDLITKIEDEVTKMQLAIDIKDEKLKKKAIDCLSAEESKTMVVLTLKPDERIEYLNKIVRPERQFEIIDSIENDEDKIKNLSLVTKEKFRTRVIESLEDDKLKEKYIDTIEEEDNKLSIIVSLNEDKDKLDMMKKLSFPIAKNIVMASLKDREKVKERFLKKDRKYKSLGLKKDTTAGMEIESWGATDFYFLKIAEFMAGNEETDDSNKKSFNKWSSKIESSVGGMEVVSPILTDNEKQVEEIYMMCEMLKEGNQKADQNCGGHVHIGFSALKNNIYAVDFLEEMYANCEKVLYIISNEKGDVPHLRILNFATPMGPRFKEKNTIIKIQEEEDNRYKKFDNRKLENSDETSNDELDDINQTGLRERMLLDKKIQSDRYVDLNLMNVQEVKNTIEFRAPNGTLNPDTWIENIRLFGRLVEKSEELAEIYQKENRTAEEEKLLKQEEKLTTNISDDEKFETLMQILFDEDERRVYNERYSTNKQIIENNVENEKNPLFGLRLSSQVNIVRDEIIPISEIKNEDFMSKNQNENSNENLNTSVSKNSNTNLNINTDVQSNQKDKSGKDANER